MRGIIRLPILTIIYNRYKTASPSRNAVVELRIAYNKKQKYLSTGIFLLPKEWDDRNRCIINRTDAAILNKTLDKLVNEVRQVIYDMIDEGRIDIFAVPARMQAKKRRTITFLEFCQERATIRKYGLSLLRQKAWDRIVNFLSDYGKFGSFGDVNEPHIMELDRYLIKKKMMPSSRWNNYHRFLNSFIIDAQKEGLMLYNPYDRIRIERGDDSEAINKYLTSEELQLLRNAVLTDVKQDRARDLFVFSCYTCLSYVDLQAFDMKNVKERDGAKIYEGHRGKTSVEFTIPLLQPALDIIEKYGGKLPVYSNQRYNQHLHDVVEAVGITKPITTHWARHTGATILLNAGVPMNVIARIGGWKDTKVLRHIYAKMHPETVVAAVTEIEDKLK